MNLMGLQVQTSFHGKTELDEVSSPLDSNMLLKKKNKGLHKINAPSTDAPGFSSRMPGLALKVNTEGLSLMSNVKACNEGMSPLMERFAMNKLKSQE